MHACIIYIIDIDLHDISYYKEIKHTYFAHYYLKNAHSPSKVMTSLSWPSDAGYTHTCLEALLGGILVVLSIGPWRPPNPAGTPIAGDMGYEWDWLTETFTRRNTLFWLH